MMSEFKKQVLTQISTLLTAAFGLVAALAWNGAIQAMFKQVFGTADSLVPMLAYAIVVTVIAVIVMILIGRMMSKNQ